MQGLVYVMRAGETMGRKLKLVGVVLDGREKFRARRDAAARNKAPTPDPAVVQPKTNVLPMNIGNSTQSRAPSSLSRPAFGGILLSVTEGLVLLRKYAGELDKETGMPVNLFTVIPAPARETDMHEYTERFACHGWNAFCLESAFEGKVIRVPLQLRRPIDMLRNALVQRYGSFTLSEHQISQEWRFFDKDPLVMPPIM